MSTQEHWIEAIQILVPNSAYHMSGNTYEGLVWLDENNTKPTQAELESKVTEIVNGEPLKLLREIRNRKLTETDWWASSDLTMTAEQTAYRQSLRDITDTYSSLDDVVWPTKP